MEEYLLGRELIWLIYGIFSWVSLCGLGRSGLHHFLKLMVYSGRILTIVNGGQWYWFFYFTYLKCDKRTCLSVGSREEERVSSWGSVLSYFIKEMYYWKYSCVCVMMMMIRASLLVQMVKNLPAMQETCLWSLGWEDPLEKGMATHSSIRAWRIPWTEEPGRL